MQDLPSKGFVLDLPKTCDEVLVLLAREAGLRRALDALILRYWPKVKAMIPHLVRGTDRKSVLLPGGRLSAEDMEDVEQQAFFWMQEAIEHYDAGHAVRAHGCTFATFLKRVVAGRLRNWLRGRQRFQKRFGMRIELAGRQDSALQIEDESTDWQEIRGAFERALTAIPAPDQLLWQELCRGRQLVDLPNLLGVTYRTVRRRWSRLRAHLVSALRGIVPAERKLFKRLTKRPTIAGSMGYDRQQTVISRVQRFLPKRVPDMMGAVGRPERHRVAPRGKPNACAACQPSRPNDAARRRESFGPGPQLSLRGRGL